MLEVQNLCFSYGNHQILNNINLIANKGEFISLLGKNGVGKSTLFKCILNILSSYSGTVIVDGQNTRTMSVRKRAQKIAYIPQMSASAFNYSVEDIVLMGTTASLSFPQNPGIEEKRRVKEALRRMGIENLRQCCFHHLSAGEKQLVIIARALAQQSDILLLDEPDSALDFSNQIRIMKEVKNLSKEGYLVIQSTHDPQKAYMYSDRIIAMKDGSILTQGTPSNVLTEQNIKSLYGVDTKLTSIFDDKVRIFTPKDIQEFD